MVCTHQHLYKYRIIEREKRRRGDRTFHSLFVCVVSRIGGWREKERGDLCGLCGRNNKDEDDERSLRACVCVCVCV